ncbi:ABC transporter ATP-binding protein [Bacillus thuringiensis]|uniref:ABC transporter ATP-binding protein n=3 Tax=Bacillus thuringiensis TaxID=1428 RepID=A0AB35PGL2_BACTU|nr:MULTISPECIES: ATP-binding cassette domain-containing protein [Bacillus]EAO52944.1 Multidrug resistance ABC transporter ATP-binding and permease protein [Bacillus thuringiensis serovar israelensis ATCC 35646]MED1157994.1 ABC transporter ATP-binding protein [Bacillus paranthracis]AJH03356.1 ABC transporter family protein [Bacillus thuringiensis HD1002]APF32631.1 multidrug ABC transporter permease [Bacillus thuringiensis serovar israelensis]EEM98782.1 Multidrug resistance ABC transporter ATP-b
MMSIIQNIRIYFKEYLADYKKEIVQIFFLLAVGIGISITLPIIVSIFIDSLDNSSYQSDFFISLAGIYLAMLFVKIIVETINSYISERLGWTISNKLRVNLVRHSIDLDFNFHKKYKTGEMIERVDGDVTFLSNFFSMFLVNIIGNSIFVLLIITMFYIKSGLIGICYSIIAIFAYFVFLSLQEKIVKLWTAYREDEAQLYGYIQESISAREDILGIGEKNYFKSLLKKYLHKTKVDFRKAVVISNIPTSGFFALLNVGDLIAIGIGVYLFYKNEMTMGTIYLISTYVGLLNRPFIALRYELENLQKIGASLNRISELFAFQSKISTGNIKLNKEKLSIDVKNVSFSYGDTPVLTDISFQVKQGETIGIVGKTGSGKTTLIKLLAKMYDIETGSILINDKNIKELDVKDFYKHICFISQNSRIFNGTVYENLTCFDSSVSHKEVNDVIEKIGLTDWVASLPEGIHTVINHSMLSAGQEQLLYIGKAFLNEAQLYIFDEVNSKLDEKSEDKIFQALKKLTYDKTVFIIAHKLKLLELVDKVLILENGKIKLYDERKHVSNRIIEGNL